jgi:hypothetical protein
MKGRPVFRVLGMAVRKYPTGKDPEAVFNFGIISEYRGWESQVLPIVLKQ